MPMRALALHPSCPFCRLPEILPKKSPFSFSQLKWFLLLAVRDSWGEFGMSGVVVSGVEVFRG